MGHHRLAMPELGRIFRGETVLGLSEWQLLERYLERRDEAAFEAFVARHGPMVLAVCRRMLVDPTDVEDAFQATFLVLVRRARHLGPRDAIGGWLHGVATRVALRARSEAARRRRLEPIVPGFAAIIDDHSTANRELGEVLDHELSRLPSKYRDPIVLCYMEGQTHEEAARQLRWPIGTVKGRLSRARDLLQSRLARRGLAPTVGALSLALSPNAPAAIHHELLDRTVKASLKLGLGHATGQVVSLSITSLVEGVLTTMFLNSLKWAGAAVFVCGLAFTGVGVMARQDAPPAREAAAPSPKAQADDAKRKTPAATPFESPVADDPEQFAPAAIPSENVLPPNPDGQNLIARGPNINIEFRTAAATAWDHAIKEFTSTNTGLDQVYEASKRLMDAQIAMAETSQERVSLTAEHRKRIREIARIQHSAPSTKDPEAVQLRAYDIEAGLWIAQAMSGAVAENKKLGEGPRVAEGQGKDPKSQAILAKLDEPLSMSFHEDTPLEKVLEYIKTSTSSKSYHGIPIYVDPIGLQEAEKTMHSTVRGMDLEGIPLRRTLQLLLKQIDLIYFVEDGVLCITAAGSESTFGPTMHEPSMIELKVKKAERGELTKKEMEEFLEFLKTRQQVVRLGSLPPPEGGVAAPIVLPEGEESKQNKAIVELLIKQTRELVDMLSVARQPRKSPEGKSGPQ